MIPNQITTSRFDSWLRRALRIRDRSVVPALATELLAVTGFELDRPEHYWPAETALVEAGSSVTTVAGSHIDAGVRNPAGSGLVVVVKDAVVSASGAAAQITWSIRAEQALTARQAFIRDSRQAGPAGITSQGAVHFSDAIALPPLTVGPRLAIAQNVPLSLPGSGWVLFPGFEFAIGSLNGVNEYQCGFSWYERPFEPSEESGG